MDLTINPTDLDGAGIYYFQDPARTTYAMSFVASRIDVRLVNGPDKLFFDFVGKHQIYCVQCLYT